MSTRHKRSNTNASLHSLQNVNETTSVHSNEDKAAQPISSQQTLSQAIWERRGEYTRPDTVRIKIGTWNLAAKQGTEKDIAGWFIGGKGVAESLTGIGPAENGETESVDEQEDRHTQKESTLPLKDHASVPSGSDIGIYVLGLQEVVDINSVWEHSKPWADPSASNKFKNELASSLPAGYELVAEKQLIGMLLLIWAAPTVAPHIRSVSTRSIGTGGLMNSLGNKGATLARLVLGETTKLVFVNVHMAAGAEKADLERRNRDAETISSKIQFDPIVDSLGVPAPHGEKIGDEDFAFWFGDLNYRLEGIPGNDVRRLLMLHTRNEYDLKQKRGRAIEAEIRETTQTMTERQAASENGATTPEDASSRHVPGDHSNSSVGGEENSSPSAPNSIPNDEPPEDPTMDPASLQTTLNSLLPHDELQQQMAKRKMFHDGWQEGPITFLPTYKYDVGSVGRFDSSDKRRGPSWCDRIIFRTRKDVEAYKSRVQEEAEMRRRDDELRAKGVDRAAEDESTLFDYDPDADAEPFDEEEGSNSSEIHAEKIITKEGYEDILALEYYLSHQRVLSSDHKPLEAIFTLKYDAVIADLKSKVHAEVAWNLDRAENEARPIVTLIVDGDSDDDSPDSDDVHFGELQYRESKTRTLTLANNGRVTAQFGFVDRPVGKDGAAQPSPRWLTIDIDLISEGRGSKKKTQGGDGWDADIGKSYKLEPGETCTIALVAAIQDHTLLREFNAGLLMEDVLVLRIKDGRDHFLPVHGSWQQSVYGQAIDKLAQVPEGGIRRMMDQPSEPRSTRIRDDSSVKERKEGITLPSTPDAAIADANVVNTAQIWSAPREIYRLTAAIEALSERLLAEWSMLASVPQTELRLATSTATSPTHEGELGSVSADAGQQPPWTRIAGWPFDLGPKVIDSARHRRLRLDVDQALDTDQDFGSCWSEFDSPITTQDKVETLASALTELLSSLADGIVSEDMFASIDSEYFTKAAKDRSAMSTPQDDQRAAILEILSCSRAHSVSFVLITSMLTHLASEISSALQEAPSFDESVARAGVLGLGLESSKIFVKRRALPVDNDHARRQLIKKTFAAIFADAMVRVCGIENTGKAFKESEVKRREIIEMFLGD